MNIHQILLEGTYILNFVEPIYNTLYEKFKLYNKKTSTKLNITNMIPEKYNPKKYKVFITYRVNKKTVFIGAEPVFKENDEGDDVLSSFRIDFTSPTPLIEYNEKELFNLKETLKHEMTHILDSIRGDGKSQNLDMEKSFKNPLTYLKDPSEINALINLIKEYAIKNKRGYNKISSYEDLLQIILDVGQSSVIQTTPEILKDKNLKLRILKRLARENILPKSLS